MRWHRLACAAMVRSSFSASGLLPRPFAAGDERDAAADVLPRPPDDRARFDEGLPLVLPGSQIGLDMMVRRL